MAYQVGELESFTTDDPVFEDRNEAEALAIKKSREALVMGVWTSQEEGSDLVSIAHEGLLFRN